MTKPQRKKPRYQLEAELKNRIPANLEAQAKNNSYCPPPLYYKDIRFKCVDCGTDEVWTAAQQQWWYEVAKGPLFSKAIRCRACRRSFATVTRGAHAELMLNAAKVVAKRTN